MDTHKRIDFLEVNSAAAGRWPDIMTMVGGIESAKLTTSGKPCPICGGTDRFSVFKDFEQTGGMTCRHCFNGSSNPKCGNGISSVAWLLGIDPMESARRIADYLGLSADSIPVDIIAAVCRDKRMPVDAFKKFGATEDMRGKLPVARVPVYNGNGHPHSYFDFVPGQKGWCKKGKGNAGLFLPGRLPESGETWLLVEGGKDPVALVDMGYNAAGLPTSTMHEKYAGLFAGCHIVLVPDMDMASVKGFQKTAGRLVGIAASIKIVRLPGEVVQCNGDDVRDVLGRPDGQSMVRKAIADAADFEPQQGNLKPAVYLTFDESAVADLVIASLNRKDLRVYQRAGLLVHVTDDTSAVRGVEIPAGQKRIRQLQAASLRELITTTADLLVSGDDEDKASRPPGWLVNAIHQRGSYELAKIPPLAGIVTCPTLRPDGSVIQSSGYDPTTGLLYVPDCEYPAIPDAPTQDEAHAATAELIDIVCDFPFADDAHRSAWLSLVLTLVGRPAIDAPCPLFAIDGNTRGSGKSKLADLAGMIAIGSTMARKALPGTDEETRKCVTAIAIEALPAVLFDNVSRILGCSSLDAALTGTQWQDRILGKSETTGTLPLTTVWIATGNNLSIGADTARRTVYCRLESMLENPEDRTEFKHANIIEHCKTNRARLAVAAVTILRGYLAAGCPDVGVRNWGSFEQWSNLICGATKWSGFADPMATRTLIRDADRSTELLIMLQDGIESVAGDDGLTAADMAKLLSNPIGPDQSDENELLRSAIDELCEPKLSGGRLVYSSRKIGYRLRSFAGRVCSGRRLVRDERTSKGNKWRIERIESAAQLAGLVVVN